ncbi:MAG: hypothetical protein QM766_18115 [Burkholderiaceae bacterium]
MVAVTPPSGRRPITSVNVPPRSIQNDQRAGRSAAGDAEGVGPDEADAADAADAGEAVEEEADGVEEGMAVVCRGGQGKGRGGATIIDGKA